MRSLLVGFSKSLSNILFLFLLFCLSKNILAQCLVSPNLESEWEIPFTFPNQAMTVEHDKNGQPYLYVAGKEKGLLIYDLTNINSPVLSYSITVSSLDDLELMSLSQDGNYLYLALGNIFSGTENPGMAIVDVTDPALPILKDVWKFSSATSGAGIVKVEGDYAYLGAMEHGLIILDISDKTDIVEVSQFIPSISYPNPNSPDPKKYNARGMSVKNSIVYLCYDAGGLRIINANDKSNPVETGRYSNPLLMNRPRAYNNIVLNDTLVYIAIDYCGMEVLNVADTSNIKQVGWWNPWKCETAANTWFNSPGHANEIVYNDNCKMVFMSTGKSDVHAVSVANPAQPDSCDNYGGVDNSQGTWGIGMYEDKLFAAYIFVPLGIPFYSNWGGVKMISWNDQCSSLVDESKAEKTQFHVYPNPSCGQFTLRSDFALPKRYSIEVFDMMGVEIYAQNISGGLQTDKQEYAFDFLSAGNYLLSIKTENYLSIHKLVVIKN